MPISLHVQQIFDHLRLCARVALDGFDASGG
jgi:hypothetical protein